MDERTRRLLTAPIGPTLLRMAAPNVLVMLVQASIGLIETYFIAQLGTDALAGMALVFPVVMMVQMISAGAMGGGIMSAVSRTLGAGRRVEADALVWHATLIALLLGAATTVAALVAGPALYAALGGREGSLAAALTYSNTVFLGILFMWLFNSLAAVIRGTGNMMFPAAVMVIGAVILIPLSRLLIFGGGPVPALGIVGGAIAFVLYYVAGTAACIAYLWAGRTMLRPTPLPPALHWAPAGMILKVGVISSLVSVTTNVTIAFATGFAGTYGPAAVAGYGTGARLEYLLVPLVFGLGSPMGALVGTAIGAGDRRRALRIAWTGALIAGLLTEAIGIAAALRPEAWLRLFGDDPAMIETGSLYLRIVGPFYGAFGLGLALYFAAQGAGRVGWPLIGGLLRVAVAVGGGLVALRTGAGLAGVFLALGIALLVFPAVTAGSILLGGWAPERRARPSPAE
ncbi:MATE family efflux transporter [Enterovirga rhinocerotis]|uniref:Putative MATE family efflux protein n=1 Tax=Enterovirga rhinocerotis TaxID=1339210 RepID=A0A4R7BX72_9HYPH|nr:MATE family efflux transporter [Enterovirga rhinocerotis]TDR90504.1 putative MATE family efflux protein [Enterovirga rhinocerotis]